MKKTTKGYIALFLSLIIVFQMMTISSYALTLMDPYASPIYAGAAGGYNAKDVFTTFAGTYEGGMGRASNIYWDDVGKSTQWAGSNDVVYFKQVRFSYGANAVSLTYGTTGATSMQIYIKTNTASDTAFPAAVKDSKTLSMVTYSATPVGTIDLPSTGNWGTYKVATGAVNIPKGTYDVYFRFVGGVNFRSFQFVNDRSIMRTTPNGAKFLTPGALLMFDNATATAYNTPFGTAQWTSNNASNLTVNSVDSNTNLKSGSTLPTELGSKVVQFNTLSATSGLAPYLSIPVGSIGSDATAIRLWTMTTAKAGNSFNVRLFGATNQIAEASNINATGNTNQGIWQQVTIPLTGTGAVSYKNNYSYNDINLINKIDIYLSYDNVTGDNKYFIGNAEVVYGNVNGQPNVTGLTAIPTENGTGNILLKWTEPTNSHFASVKVFKSTDDISTATPLAVITKGMAEATITGNVNTSSAYQVVAYDDLGYFSVGVTSATVTPTDGVFIPNITSEVATGSMYGIAKVTVTWLDAPETDGVKIYNSANQLIKIVATGIQTAIVDAVGDVENTFVLKAYKGANESSGVTVKATPILPGKFVINNFEGNSNVCAAPFGNTAWDWSMSVKPSVVNTSGVNAPGSASTDAERGNFLKIANVQGTSGSMAGMLPSTVSKISYWLKVDSTVEAYNLPATQEIARINFWGSGSTLLSNKISDVGYGKWKYIEQTFATPLDLSNGTSMTFYGVDASVTAGVNNVYIDDITLYDNTPAENVANLNATYPVNGNTNLSWQAINKTNRINYDFAYYRIYKNGNLLQDKVLSNSATIEAAIGDVFKVTTMDYFGNESSGMSKTVLATIITVNAKTKTANPTGYPMTLDFTDVGASTWNFSGTDLVYNEMSKAGCYGEITFKGIDIKLIGYTDTNTGNIDVYIDGSPAPNTDNGKVTIPRAATKTPNQTLYQASNLSSGTHTLKFVTRNDNADGGNYFELQRLEYVLYLSDDDKVDKCLSDITWDTIKNSNTLESSVRDSLDLSMINDLGVGLTWSATPAGLIDVATGKVTMSTTGEKQVTLTATANIGTVTKAKNFNLTIAQIVSLNAKTLVSTPTGYPSTFTLTNVGSSTWNTESNANFIYNEVSNVGCYGEFTFSGSAVRIVGYTDYNTGNIDVFIDDTPAPGTVNGKLVIPQTGTKTPDTVLYQASNLTSGIHKLKFVTRGDNAGGSNYFQLQRVEYVPYVSDVGLVDRCLSDVTWDNIKNNNIDQNDVKMDLTLPVSNAWGVTQTWSADPLGYIDTTTGVINLDATDTKQVTLTLTASKGSVTKTKDFVLLFAKGIPYSIRSSLKFYSNDQQLRYMQAGTIVAKAQLRSNYNNATQLKFIVGKYEITPNGYVLKNINIQLIPFNGKDTVDLNASITISENEKTNTVIKGFILEDLEKIIPITDPNQITPPVEGIYVSTSGSDANVGTYYQPFKTIERAKTEAKVVLAQSQKPVNVYILGGTYNLETPIVFTPDDSGTLENPITYNAIDGEEVIISGSKPLPSSLQWSDYSANTNIKVADIGTGFNFDALYANGQRQILSRYPNFTNPDTLFGFDGNSTDVLTPSRVLAKWKTSPAGGYIRALHAGSWGGNDYIINGMDASGNVSYTWVGDNNRGSDFNSNKMMVENIFEELDAPSEWFYNKTTGKLYFYPPNGLNLATTQFEGSTQEELIKFVGTTDSKVKHIAFNRVKFTKTHRTMFTRTYERPLRGDWGIVRAGSVYMENAENITVKNCTFNDLGGNAVMMSGYNRNHVVDYNDMTQIGASGVLIVGKESSARDASTWDNNLHKSVISDTTPGPLTNDYAKDITISNNYIYDIGLYEKQVAGVCISIAESVNVKGNTLHRGPRSGINISDGTFGGHIIENNDVFDFVRGTSDHGPFNSWGRDRFWSLGGYNTSGSNGVAKSAVALLDAIKTSIIRNNRFHHNGDFGIDLDDGSSNYEIYNNLLLGTGIKLREGFQRKVYNNIIVNNGMHIHVSYANNNDSVTNNIIISNDPYRFVSANAGSKTTFDKNIIYYGNTALSVKSSGNSVDTNYVNANPLFVDATKNNYSVRIDSPALTAGFHNIDLTKFGRADKPKPPAVAMTYTAVDPADPEPFLGASITSIYSQGIQTVTTLPDFNGVFFLAVPADSFAYAQGFKEIDVIRKINGTTITNKASFWATYNAIPSGGTVTAVVYRNSVEMAQPITFVKP